MQIRQNNICFLLSTIWHNETVEKDDLRYTKIKNVFNPNLALPLKSTSVLGISWKAKGKYTNM